MNNIVILREFGDALTKTDYFYTLLVIALFILLILFELIIIVNDINSFSDFSEFCKKSLSKCLQKLYLKLKNNPKRPVPQYIKEVKYGGYTDDYVEELIDYCNALECKIIELESKNNKLEDENYNLEKKIFILEKRLNRNKTKGGD